MAERVCAKVFRFFTAGTVSLPRERRVAATVGYSLHYFVFHFVFHFAHLEDKVADKVRDKVGNHVMVGRLLRRRGVHLPEANRPPA